MKTYAEISDSAEHLLRSGRVAEARELLGAIKPKSIPRDQVRRIANLARRAGQSQTALKILWPVVRPDRPLEVHPDPGETAEFAVALLGLGASQEAIEILEKARAAQKEPYPTFSLYLGFAHMTRWDYQKAIPCFEYCLSASEFSEYESLIAKVNLAAAWVAMAQADDAWPLLHEILQTTEVREWHLLRKNALELSAQMAGTGHDWDLAEKYLGQIEVQRDKPLSTSDLFVRKWRALSALYRSKGSAECVERIFQVKADALRLGHWETVRDCDFHLALTQKDEHLYLRVYFGTPYSGYRQRLKTHAAGWMELPKEFVWTFGDAESPRVFDLKRGRETGGEALLKPGQTVHRALQALVSDFYRPFQVGGLHALCFPDDYYNPETGPLRVRQVITRLRSWFNSHEIPLTVGSSLDGFRLEASGLYGIRLTGTELQEPSAEKVNFQVMIEQLKELWDKEGFSSSQAAVRLGISERLARDVLKWGVDQGQLARNGAGRATRYAFNGSGGVQ